MSCGFKFLCQLVWVVLGFVVQCSLHPHALSLLLLPHGISLIRFYQVIWLFFMSQRHCEYGVLLLIICLSLLVWTVLFRKLGIVLWLKPDALTPVGTYTGKCQLIFSLLISATNDKVRGRLLAAFSSKAGAWLNAESKKIAISFASCLLCSRSY